MEYIKQNKLLIVFMDVLMIEVFRWNMNYKYDKIKKHKGRMQNEKLYFTRHGQTIWNVENKICGATDIELTEKGHEQAKALENKSKKKD